MQTNEQLLQTIENYLAQRELPSEPERLYDPIRYSLGGGGKRLRPMLLMLSCGLFSDCTETALPAAAAVEIFHNFTLLHDDIMDNAAMRRGKPSVHARWGGNVAILSGDAMLIYAYRLLGQTDPVLLPRILEVFNSMALGVCEGQQYDMEFENDREVSMAAYMKMIGLKTAVLLACSAKLGAVIAGADDRACDLLYKFGYNLGLAFQITDDYLDTYGDSEIFGKKIGGDIVNNKKTWLLTRALETGGEMEQSGVVSQSDGKTALLRAMEMKTGNETDKAAKIARVKEIYGNLGIDEDVKYEIIKLHAQAMDCAGMIGLGKVRYEMLHRYADRLLGRNR